MTFNLGGPWHWPQKNYEVSNTKRWVLKQMKMYLIHNKMKMLSGQRRALYEI